MAVRSVEETIRTIEKAGAGGRGGGNFFVGSQQWRVRGRGGVGLVGTQIFRWITTRESTGGGVEGGVITTQIFRLNTTRGGKKAKKMKKFRT